jgi:hypothetical protein
MKHALVITGLILVPLVFITYTGIKDSEVDDAASIRIQTLSQYGLVRTNKEGTVCEIYTEPRGQTFGSAGVDLHGRDCTSDVAMLTVEPRNRLTVGDRVITLTDPRTHDLYALSATSTFEYLTDKNK